MSKAAKRQCPVCYEMKSSAYVYCLVNSSGHPNLSNGTDFGEGTAHWVCSGCFDNLLNSGTAGTCPLCRSERATVNHWSISKFWQNTWVHSGGYSTSR